MFPQCSLCTCHSISASTTEQKIGSQSKLSPNCQIPWPAQLIFLLLPLSLSEIPESISQPCSLDTPSIFISQTDVSPSVVTLLPSDLLEIFRHRPSLVALLHCLREMMSPFLSPVPIIVSAQTTSGFLLPVKNSILERRSVCHMLPNRWHLELKMSKGKLISNPCSLHRYHYVHNPSSYSSSVSRTHLWSFCLLTAPSSDSTRFSQFYQPNDALFPSPDTPGATSREEAPVVPSVYPSAVGFCVLGHCSSLQWIPSCTSTADESS